MSLWVDKYRPTNLNKLDYHKTQAAYLKNLVQQGDFPHLLFYGPSGAGKKTRIMALLRELYGSGVERLRMEHMNFQTPSNKKIEIMTVSSNYHIEVNPSDAGIYDRIVIMDLIKGAAQTHQLDASGQRDFKVILLTEVDRLTKDAQHALRRTMEKYVATCRLILCANSTSQVIPAIRSRCLGVRVPAPTHAEIVAVLQNVCKKEGVPLPDELADRIAEKSNRNLRRAILMCEACKVQQFPLTKDQEIAEPDWQVYLRDTARMVLSEQTPRKLLEVRTRLYELIVHGIPTDIIFKGLLKELIKNCDLQLKTAVIELAATHEHRLHRGSKVIFYLESFIAKFMALYLQFMEETIGGMY
ncbi:replication factor C subunit 3 [Nilaparvata lugens]|uniref:replication factor C subunit 3-like n=1 Tax=Nilaparvata lugens TaxID=108931 RepID=UPI00193CD364|nr:replication factor C subunit 3-like [Nilaparvata lugens]XP_039300602.1 replication factor C subunit 3 [Nilaparvata lugens]